MVQEGVNLSYVVQTYEYKHLDADCTGDGYRPVPGLSYIRIVLL